MGGGGAGRTVRGGRLRLQTRRLGVFVRTDSADGKRKIIATEIRYRLFKRFRPVASPSQGRQRS
jgi:hypothetical protein